MRLLLLLAALAALLPRSAQAEEEAALNGVIASLDLTAWQEAADGAGAELDVAQTILAIARGEMEFSPETLFSLLRGMVMGEMDGFSARLMAFMGPALLWAVNRHLLSHGNLTEAAGLMCYLAGAGVMIGAVGSMMALAQDTVRRLGHLTGQVFPVLAALMSASGNPGTAGALQPLAVAAGGGLASFVERVLSVLGGSAAALAAAGNLSERISLGGLFRLCVSVGNWLLGAAMAVFLAMIGLTGVVGGAQDSVTLRAARYAADNLLPVVGGDVADAMGVMAQSASLVRSAAGVTGVILMIAVCLRPVISLALGMLLCRLSAALTEPVSDGPLRKCMDGMGQVMRLMLAAVSVSASLFIALTGACLTAG